MDSTAAVSNTPVPVPPPGPTETNGTAPQLTNAEGQNGTAIGGAAGEANEVWTRFERGIGRSSRKWTNRTRGTFFRSKGARCCAPPSLNASVVG